ncbi:thioredoxin domain-containing protein 15 [Plakobranchus ocellatus]|uniref:Thioredoxin domain-containing protein 15 n=1 Tax=Plakobranchus ocellatus TaxID=259542 RepID=A0AAV4BHG0_9GAST|nr:thioredoxin domain-containing protein 15 [Plakobranchus ocellatus]
MVSTTWMLLIVQLCVWTVTFSVAQPDPVVDTVAPRADDEASCSGTATGSGEPCQATGASGISPSLAEASEHLAHADDDQNGKDKSPESNVFGVVSQTSEQGKHGESVSDESDLLDTAGNGVDSEEDSESPHLQVIGMTRKKKLTTTSSDPNSDTEPNSSKRKIFPFLHISLFSTFKSLVYSFLSEFVEESASQDTSANSSEWNNQSSVLSDEEGIKDSNSTANITDSVKRTRFQCSTKNVTAENVGKVKIVNSTELLDILSLSKSQKLSACVLVMFYAPWCHFCAQTAPHYNALARAFPQLDILAVDTSHFSYLNARFGTVAVPNIMLFHARSAVRFNHTSRILDKFTQFVTNNTGLEPRKFVLLEPLDFVGPLPCVVRQGRDWLLWLAWVFVATCTAYGFVQSQYGQGFIARLKVLWQEHQHID